MCAYVYVCVSSSEDDIGVGDRQVSYPLYPQSKEEPVSLITRGIKHSC